MTKTLRVGLTGGIASGKSTVARLFAELGADIVDTDVIAREVVQPGRPALEEIAATFGSEVLTADGALDRGAMRRLVFADDAARHRLEAILHPRIGAETRRQAEAGALASRDVEGYYQIIVVPLLVESELQGFVDRVLVVDCDPETQIRRLLDRDAGSVDQARRMLAAQASREQRLAIADEVIDNDGDLESTRAQVVAVHEMYRSLA